MLLALSALLVALVPQAGATTPVQQPLVGVCVDGVKDPGCYDGGWICVGFSYQIPFCVEHLPIAVEQPPAVSCTELVAVGAAGAVCYVGGKQVGPVATCEACYPAIYVVCTESTTGQPVTCRAHPEVTAQGSSTPPVYSCNAATKPCENGATACFAISQQVPHCVNVDPILSLRYGACLEGKEPCPRGKLACVTKDGAPVACAPDPCYTTMCFSAPARSIPIKPGYCIEGQRGCPPSQLACATNNGEAVACVYDPCATTNCFNAQPAAAPVECYDMYARHEIGPVGIEMRSSCDVRVTYEGESPLA